MRGSIGGNQGAVEVGNMGGADFVLHPLIHTLLELNLVQDVENRHR
jgi:hypothetical protein